MGRSWADSREHPAQYLRIGDDAVIVGTDEGPRQSRSRRRSRTLRGGLVTAEEQEDAQHCQFLAGGLTGPRLSGYLVG